MAPPYDPALPGVSISGTTAGATREVGEPDAGGAASLGTVWYRYTAPAGSRLGTMGYRVTDRSAFTVAAYVPYVQLADPVPYLQDGVVALTNMYRVTSTGYDSYGTLPGDTTGSFLPVVRIEPGATVWFQVSANPAAASPVDGTFELELFSVDDRRESIGYSIADFRGGCQDPLGCQVTFWGDTSAASPAPIGPADHWSTVQVDPGTMVTITARSSDSHWRGSTRPIRVSVYTHPSNLPIWGVTDVSQLGSPVNMSTGGLEVVDGADYGLPGSSTLQWVGRVDVSFAVSAYHIRVEGDPTFVAVTVATQGPGTLPPTVTISAPVNGASYASPADVPALAYTCTAGSSPIASSLVRVDGVGVAGGDPLPTSAGQHVVVVECTDADGAAGTASATYTVATDLVVPDQTIVVDEDSSTTVDLLGGVTVPPGLSATLTGIGPAAHGSATVVGGSVAYTPSPDYFGPDQFTYQVTSSTGSVATATVSVTVAPLNDPPVAVDDALAVDARSSIEVDFAALLANDVDIDGGAQTVTSITRVAGTVTGGLVSCAGQRPGCRLYVAPSSPGTESFDYVVDDGAGGTDTGRLTITVRPIALPDYLFVSMPCDNVNVSGATIGIRVIRQFGVVLIRGLAQVGSIGAAFRVIGFASGGFAYGWITAAGRTLIPETIANPIGDTWIVAGHYRVGRQVCPFQVNVRDGG